MKLQTADAALVHARPDWRTRILAAITDPSIALLLMTIGIYGLIFEFSNPGTALPGVVGGICLLIGLYALQLLPVNYAGLALILFGIALMIAEAFLPAYGALGVGGVTSFIVGAIILIDTEVPGYGIPIGLITTVAAISGVVIAGVIGMAVKARRLVVVSGAEQLIGSTGQVIESGTAETWAHVHGERWKVISKSPLRGGQQVRVLARQGLVLEVTPVL